MTEDVEWAEENNKVHGHIPTQGCKYEPGVVGLDAPRSRDPGGPLGVERIAADQAQDDENEVPSAQAGDQDMA